MITEKCRCLHNCVVMQNVRNKTDVGDLFEGNFAVCSPVSGMLNARVASYPLVKGL